MKSVAEPLNAVEVSVVDVLRDIGALPAPEGMVPVVVRIDKHGDAYNFVNPEYQLNDQDVCFQTLFITASWMEKGKVKLRSGRTQANSRQGLWLALDCDAHHFLGVPISEVHEMEDDEIERVIERQASLLARHLSNLGIELHQVHYSGYGITGLICLSEEAGREVATLPLIHKAIIRKVNDAAGLTLIDPSASDGPTRFTKIPGCPNKKNPNKIRYGRIMMKIPDGERKLLSLAELCAIAEVEPAQEGHSVGFDVATEGFPLSEELREEILANILPYWIDTARNGIGIGMSGMLAYNGVPEAEAYDLLTEIWERGSKGDTTLSMTMSTVKRSYARMRCDGRVMGYHLLREYIPPRALRVISKALDSYTFQAEYALIQN